MIMYTSSKISFRHLSATDKANTMQTNRSQELEKQLKNEGTISWWGHYYLATDNPNTPVCYCYQAAAHTVRATLIGKRTLCEQNGNTFP